MRKENFILLALVFFSCSFSPFDETQFADCDHSPGNPTGKSSRCPVQLQILNELRLRFNALAKSSLQIENTNSVQSVLDLSGQGADLKFKEETLAQFAPGSTNDRNSLRFVNPGGVYSSEASSILIPERGSFSFVINFKVLLQPAAGEEPLFIFSNLLKTFQVEVFSNLSLALILNGVEISLGVTVEEERPQNLFVIFDGESSTLRVFHNESLVKAMELEPDILISWQGIEIKGRGESELQETLLYNEALTNEGYQEVLSYLRDTWGY